MYEFQEFYHTHFKMSWENFKQKYRFPLLLIEKRSLKSVESGKEDQGTTAYLPRPEWLLFQKGRTAGTPLASSRIFDFRQALAKKFTFYVGRKETNLLVLKDASISNVHACFQWKTSQMNPLEDWYIMDMGSANGTFVNGVQLKSNVPQMLKSKDGITFSHVYFCTFFHPQDFFQYLKTIQNL